MTNHVKGPADAGERLPSCTSNFQVDSFESPCCETVATVALNLFHTATAAVVVGAILKFAFKATIVTYGVGALVAGLAVFAILSYLSCSKKDFYNSTSRRNSDGRMDYQAQLSLTKLPMGVKPGSVAIIASAKPATPIASQPIATSVPTLTLPPSAAASAKSDSPRIGGEAVVVETPPSSRKASIAADQPSTPPAAALATAIVSVEPPTPSKQLPQAEALISAAPAAPAVDAPAPYYNPLWALTGYGFFWGTKTEAVNNKRGY